MSSSARYPRVVCICLLIIVVQVHALHSTIRIDDTDPAVISSPGWISIDYPNAYGGSYMFSETPGAWIDVFLPHVDGTTSLEYMGFQAYISSTYYYCIDCSEAANAFDLAAVATLPASLSSALNRPPILIFTVSNLDQTKRHVLTIMNVSPSTSRSGFITFDGLIVNIGDPIPPIVSSSVPTSSSSSTTTSNSPVTRTSSSTRTQSSSSTSTSSGYSSKTSLITSQSSGTSLTSNSPSPTLSGGQTSPGFTNESSTVFPIGTSTSDPPNSPGPTSDGTEPVDDDGISPAVISILACIGFLSLILGAIVFLHTRRKKLQTPPVATAPRRSIIDGDMSEYTDDSSNFYFVAGRTNSRHSRNGSPIPSSTSEPGHHRRGSSVITADSASISPSGRSIRQRAMTINQGLIPQR